MQNYHRHSSYSNIMTPDCAINNEAYAKRAVELGHKVLSSVEHGWQGYYFETYELAKKYNLKCIIGAEAYWVKDRLNEFYPTGKYDLNGNDMFSKDKSNNHIIILAKNNKGREALNDILSEANISGYYYKPRVDLELLLSLPSNDVFVTTACIGFKSYEDTNDIILKLHNHFKDNFMLEIQYHNTEEQKKWNKNLLELSNKYDIELIVGLDSHYINEKDSEQRDIVLEAKGIKYENEEGWYMDYPDDEIVMNRFLEQGIFTKEQIQRAMDNTDVCLTFDDYDNIPIFNKDIKLPTLYPDKTKEEKDKIYSKLITKKFKEYMKNIPKEEYDKYFEGVKMEVQTYKDTGMVDYPLLDYAIVKDAVEHGGIITSTGRGSCCGFFTNTLCGFSKVDRFNSAIKLYPERFISTTRILETKSLPDIDMNLSNVEIFEESQKRILGENHAVPMIAFGTLKKKSAFKIYAKAKGLDFETANEISSQITQYDEAVKQAEEDEKDSINIYDYIDEKYSDYIEQSKEYWGIISDKKKAPSAYLLYQGNIRKEIGLIKCKSESTKKEYVTCIIDGAIAENYKFLKNDLLKVDSVLLIDEVFKRIGIKSFDVNTLLDKIKNNDKVWDLYANGYTIGINQVEQNGSRHKCMNYKPKNISELSAFVAAIRPGFKSMYNKFEKREDFKWGINALDNLIRTEELPVSFLFFQEQVMSVLNYAGFPMDECYGIIKAIAKKHPEKVKPLKSKFIEGFKNQVMIDEGIDEELAKDYSNQVWTIINDNCNYSFNCISGDTKIIKGAQNSSFNPTIEEMYLIKNDRNYAKKTNHLSLHNKYKKYGYGQALSMYSNGKLRPNRIVSIKPSGIRQTYKIITKSGCDIVCTDNHKFPTPNGELELKKLKVGDLLFCKGNYEIKNSRSKRYENGIKTFLDEVISIVPHKIEQVYDICMDDPYHTFVSESGLVTSNSSHAFCMALDSTYQAWQKANYPYEFYEVLLQHYSNKGNKDKVSLLKKEMKDAFGIIEGAYKFRADNRKFVLDKDNKCIYPALSSIKGISNTITNYLYSIKDIKFNNFFELLKHIGTKISSDKMTTLIKIDYFSEFGEINQLLKQRDLFNDLFGKKILKKSNIPDYIPLYLIEKYSDKKSEKQYRFTEEGMNKLILELSKIINYPKTTEIDKIKNEAEYLGYIQKTIPNTAKTYCFVQSIDRNFVTLYQLKTGNIYKIKFRKKDFEQNPFEENQIIKILNIVEEPRWYKDSNNKWQRDYDSLEKILKKWIFVVDKN